MNFYTLALTALEPASVHKPVSAQKLSKGSKFNVEILNLRMHDVYMTSTVKSMLMTDIGDEICW